MDEDEAFLYGESEPDEPNHDQETPALPGSTVQAPPSAPKPACDLVLSTPATPEPSQNPATEPTATAPAPPPPAELEPPLDLSTEPAPLPQDPIGDQQARTDAQVIELSEEEDDEDEDEEAELSEDDLHIILDADGAHPHSAPSARPSLSSVRPEIQRELPPPPPVAAPAPAPPVRADVVNITTDYKPLERHDSKHGEMPAPGPTRLPPAPTHQHRNMFEFPTHNRQPTPEGFQRPNTPPPDPTSEDPEASTNPEAPLPLTGYDDKDGLALMEFDFDGLTENEKGWRKPGAHVADWFNYGFDETTWRWYIMKQKRLRGEESWASNPFARFATGDIQEAWDALPQELKGVMMQTIMGPTAVTNGNHAAQMQAPMPPMMVMNPMMQGMDMGGFGMQGMQGMMGNGNGPMNGAHNNSGMNNQHNDGPSRGMKQDASGEPETGGDTPGHYGDGMDPREQQHHHEQQRMQDQMRHMQHMQHMGMGQGFMPGMDLAAMFGNQDMFMSPGQFNGMMDMSQMQHIQHMPAPMQQQMGGGSNINMMNQNMSPAVSGGPMNTGLNPTLVPNAGLPTTSSPAIQTTPAIASTPVNAGLASTPVGSPGSMPAMQSPLTATRGRGRGGRGRGNPPASAFLAAAAARGRGRVLSVSTQGPGSSNLSHAAAPISTPPQTAAISVPAPVVTAQPVVEASPERATRPISPLPSNVPTGPRKAAPANPAPTRGVRVTPAGYFDKDAAGARGDEGLDYGGGSAESPREERKQSAPVSSRRQSHRSDREQGGDEDPRDRPENYSERSRSISRDNPTDEKDIVSGSHRKSKNRHLGRSRSKESEHRSSREKSEREKSEREKSEKEKEDGSNLKSSRGSRTGRRNRRSKGAGETDDKGDTRDGPGDERERDREKEKDKDRSKDKEKERDREKQKDREREREKQKDGDHKDKGKDDLRDKESEKNREREKDEGAQLEGDHGTPASSRKRKSNKDDRGSRSSKRERAE